MPSPHVDETIASVVDTAPCGIIRFDGHARLTYLNRTMVEMSGRSFRDWFEGDAAHYFVHVDDREFVTERLASAHERRDVFEHRYVRPDGEVRWLRARTEPYRTEDGEPDGWVSVLVDITDQVAQRKRADRLVSTLEATPDLTVIVDAGGEVLFANPALRAYCGLGPTDELTVDVFESLVADDTVRTFRDEIFPTVREKGTWSGEVTLRAAGRNIPASAAISAHYGEDGRIEYFSTIVRDISDLKAVEAQLTASETWHRKLVQHGMDLVMVHDADGRATYLSPSTERIFGYRPEELLGRSGTWTDGVHPDDVDIAIAARNSVLAAPGATHWIDALRFKHRDGSYRWLEMRVTNLLEDPIVAGILTNARDITEHRVAEEKGAAALEASEARFRALVQHASDIVTIVDGEGVIRYTSPATTRILGYEIDDVIDRSLFEFVHTEDDVRARDALLEALLEVSGGTPLELSFRHVDGSLRTLEIVANNLLHDPAVAGVVINGRDVTERKLAEEARRVSEVRFTTLVENASDMIAVLGADGSLLYAAPSAQRLFGYPAGYGLGRANFDLIHPDDRAAVEQNLAVVATRPGPASTFRFRVRRADDTWVWLEANATNLLHEPAVGGIVVTARDITGQREAEEALAEREARYHALLQNLSDAVVVVDFEGDHVVSRWASPAVQNLLGYTTDELLGVGIELIHPDDQERLEADFGKLAASGGDLPPITYRARHADGSWRWLESIVKDLRDDPVVDGIVLTTRDVTAQREAAVSVARRLAFEDLLGRISSRFVNLADHEQDLGINEALRDVGEFTGADRAFVFLATPDVSMVDNTHEWCAPGIESRRTVRRDLKSDAFPWWKSLFERRIVFDVPNVAALGDEAAAEREFLQEIGCQSILAVPLASGGRLRGTLGLDAVRATMEWTEDQLRLLEAVGGLFLGALARADAHAALRESEARYRAVVEDQTDLICRYDRAGVLKFVNKAYARHHDSTPEELVGRSFFDLVPEDVHEIARASMQALTRDRPVRSYTVRTTASDGEVRWLQWTERALFDVGDIPVEYQAVARDVTEQREAEILVSDQARILEMIATGVGLPEVLREVCRVVESHVPEARCSVLLTDETGGALGAGAAPSLPPEFVEAADRIPIGPLHGSCGAAAARQEPVVCLDIASDPIWATYRDLALRFGIRSSWSTPIMSSAGHRVLGTVCIYHDAPRAPSPRHERIVDIAVQVATIAIERKAAEDRLGYQAHHDHLTGLPNRVLLSEFLGLALARSRRRGTTTALLFLDVDRFKLVNDTLGHDAGDELLMALADRLRGSVRPGDVVARFGGDEFVVIAEGLGAANATQQAVRLAHRVLAAVREPFTINGEAQFLTASIGIALAAPDHDRVELLLRNADAAMYQAKEHGRGRVELFDEALQERVRKRHEIGNALHRAVERREFLVLYQPIVSLSDGRCVGLEALLRWQHPTRGLLDPDDFLEVAEETGLIIPIGSWVLENVCSQAAEWQRRQHDDSPFVISLNLSARQLNRPGLVDLVDRTLRSTAVDPARICFEITESVLMTTAPSTIEAVRGLAELGVRVSIDDFGTGYSSLEYLKRLRADSLKIDRSFVDGLGSGTEDRAIVAAVVSLGHALRMRVVAEGVRSEAQLEELVRLGCDAAQGYLFSTPRPAAELEEIVSTPGSARLPGAGLLAR